MNDLDSLKASHLPSPTGVMKKTQKELLENSPQLRRFMRFMVSFLVENVCECWRIVVIKLYALLQFCVYIIDH